MKNTDIKEIVENYKSGKLDIAEREITKLIKKIPNNHFLYNLLGAILLGQKKLDDAIKFFKKSIKISSNYADPYNNIAGIYAQKKNYNEAINFFKKAILINPNLSEAHYNMGNSLFEVQKYNEAISSYNQAIKINPNYANAYNNLGNVFKALNDLTNAINCYEKTIKIDGNNFNAYNNLSFLYCDIGKIENAYKCFEKLSKLKPDNILYKINNALLLMPMYKSAKEIDIYRNKFLEGLKLIEKYNYNSDQPGNEIELNFYYLAYHNKNNLEVMKKLSKLFRKIIPSLNYTSKNLLKKRTKKKIKIGFISQYLTDHTVGKLFGGFVKNLNNDEFDTIVFHAPDTKDSLIKNEIDAKVDKVIQLDKKIQQQQFQVEKENLDIIFYPDIGMSPTTYFLAFSRLAPVQITSWGHTETTGIDTIDYFLSSTTIEEKNANKNYSENLICLSQFPSFFEIPKNILDLKSRLELNLPTDAHLYGCPQSLFKLHPDFDKILAEILSKDNKGYVVLIGNDGKNKYWSEILKERWKNKYDIINKKVIFTKRLTLHEFFSLSNCVDVLLIPLHFGGGNTSIEAMIFGTPSVTMPKNHLRTNITAGIYKQMKISNPPIVNSPEEYVNLALELAKNKKKNNSLREISKKAAKRYLFNNNKVLKEFEDFLKKVHVKSQLR
jgi:protein O-GlcNAc transferase